LLYTGNVGERLGEEEGYLFPSALLGQLPNLHYLARLAALLQKIGVCENSVPTVREHV
jgi:hypothetical protein